MSQATGDDLPADSTDLTQSRAPVLSFSTSPAAAVRRFGRLALMSKRHAPYDK